MPFKNYLQQLFKLSADNLPVYLSSLGKTSSSPLFSFVKNLSAFSQKKIGNKIRIKDVLYMRSWNGSQDTKFQIIVYERILLSEEIEKTYVSLEWKNQILQNI